MFKLKALGQTKYSLAKPIYIPIRTHTHTHTHTHTRTQVCVCVCIHIHNVYTCDSEVHSSHGNWQNAENIYKAIINHTQTSNMYLKTVG